MDRALFLRVLAGFLLVPLIQDQTFAQSIQDETEIRRMLQQRIEKDQRGVGIVVGILNDKGSKIVSFGRMNVDEARAVDGDSIFELGSITKVFTAILLADMVERGEVKFDDPISKYLPAKVKTPTFNGKEITLADLATHTSGLAKLPTNFHPKNRENPYAEYSVEQLYEYLSGAKLDREIGSQYDYSNVGTGLLGHLLARKAKTDFETLVIDRICKPLEMNDTRMNLSPMQKSRLATGHSKFLKPVANWDLSEPMAGAGGLHTTVNDMLRFAAANLGTVQTKMLPTLQKTHQVVRKLNMASDILPNQRANLDMALGWHVWRKHGGEIIGHVGGTGGYRTAFYFDPQKRCAVVVLSNCYLMPADIGLHILESKFDLEKFEK